MSRRQNNVTPRLHARSPRVKCSWNMSPRHFRKISHSENKITICPCDKTLVCADLKVSKRNAPSTPKKVPKRDVPSTPKKVRFRSARPPLPRTNVKLQSVMPPLSRKNATFRSPRPLYSTKDKVPKGKAPLNRKNVRGYEAQGSL